MGADPVPSNFVLEFGPCLTEYARVPLTLWVHRAHGPSARVSHANATCVLSLSSAATFKGVCAFKTRQLYAWLGTPKEIETWTEIASPAHASKPRVSSLFVTTSPCCYDAGPLSMSLASLLAMHSVVRHLPERAPWVAENNSPRR